MILFLEFKFIRMAQILYWIAGAAIVAMIILTVLIFFPIILKQGFDPTSKGCCPCSWH